MFTVDCTANKELQMTECSLNDMDFQSCKNMVVAILVDRYPRNYGATQSCSLPQNYSMSVFTDE